MNSPILHSHYGDKVASEADLVYNEGVNIVVSERYCQYPLTWIRSGKERIVEIVNPHAQNGKGHHFTSLRTLHKPLLLDLFCCAGGASKGYMDAGFYVIGVDINPQPHYIGNEFYQDDALYVLGTLITGGCWNGYTLKQFSAIHASPECKSYTNCNLSPHAKYQRLIAPMRRLLQKSGRPYIIENVMGAKRFMNASLMLCGTMFNLPMQRHRLFEFGNIDAWIRPPRPCDHRAARIGVYGHSVWDSSQTGTPRKDGRKRPDSVPLAEGRLAMGIDWMGIEELAEAIPPAYTRWIGEQLLAAMSAEEVIA